ncbi:MAG TPA: tRNA (adenosine(37)-N6)-dimethylallyltransferase MiaA [Acidiferrobacterales bacterium]|nr:tRNA (adenosine(37)-N6)-dimethylallyltransferase MiaA [Acidiferrobacterales bacterium]
MNDRLAIARPPAVFLMGPTASGKTALALALQALFPFEIISVDAAQVYRGMDIGTAKPSREELARAPHRLIDIRDPAEPYSAAQFRVDALREMQEITQRGRIPLLVGGTMFYFRALAQGLAEAPSADAGIRTQLTAEAAQIGWPAMHARLRAHDPETAARVHPHDAQRIQRALEILMLAQQPPSQLNQKKPSDLFPYGLIKIALSPGDRSRLHSRIAKRFQTMLNQGLVAEVEMLFHRGDLSLQLPSMRTVGYRQVWLYLTGKINYCEMVERGIAATRQLAKRQLTWLRSDKELHWLETDDGNLVKTGASFIRQNLVGKSIIS